VPRTTTMWRLVCAAGIVGTVAVCARGGVGGCALSGVGGCARTAASGARTDAAAVRTIRIPGTVVEFEFVRVGRTDGPDLWVARHEVTWDLYDIYLYALDVPEGEADPVTRPSKPYVPPDRGMGHAGFPAMGMTRRAAEGFCEWLSEKIDMPVRLPTEDEFQYYATLEEGEVGSEFAWTEENAGGGTKPVGSLAANSHGLFDTLGNVAEWVAGEGKPRAMGGSYLDGAEACTPSSVQEQARSWNRSDPQIPKSRWWLADCSWVGFRFVAEVEDDAAEEHGDDE
jgi:formylglycine-generating enzyme required for sulfatase activity